MEEKEIIKTETKTEKVYTFTEEELCQLKCKEREYGSRKTKEYILFCFANYVLELNIAGTINFTNRMMKFILGKHKGISNTQGIGFFEWLKEHRD